MNRREAVSTVALLIGGTMLGAEAFLSGCKSAARTVNFTPEDITYMDEIAETILPATKTPGAKAAKVGEYMSVMVKDCYDEKEQKIFLEGLDKLNDESKKKNNKPFMDSTPQQRHDLLVAIDKDARAYAKAKKKDEPAHYFSMIKRLTLDGYFTSEVGAKQALNYVAVPGKYEGCVDYKKGDRAWAT
jgi:hypothetical protein